MSIPQSSRSASGEQVWSQQQEQHAEQDPPAADNQQQPATGTAPGNNNAGAPTSTAAPQQQTEGSPPAATTQPFKTFASQKELDAHNAQIRKTAEIEAKRKSEQQAAEAAGEWEKLARERETELTTAQQERDTLQQRLDTVLELIGKENDRRLGDLPREVRDMKPDGDALVVYGWLSKAEKAAATIREQTNDQRRPAGGTPPGPTLSRRASGGGNDQDALAAKRASGDYDN